jgi:hypothetical protein
MGPGAKMGELKRAAQRLGVTSTVLREHGWKTASAERIEAVKNNPPGWLIEARERRRQKRAGQCYLRDRKATASGLGIQVRAVKARGITPGEAGICWRPRRTGSSPNRSGGRRRSNGRPRTGFAGNSPALWSA